MGIILLVLGLIFDDMDWAIAWGIGLILFEIIAVGTYRPFL